MRFRDYPALSNKVKVLDERISVTRVRPRTSKGITDLLLPRTSTDLDSIVPLRSIQNASTYRYGSYLVGRGLVR